MSSRIPDRPAVAGLAVIALLVAAGIFTGQLPVIASAAAFLLVAVMLMGYAAETAALMFFVLVSFTTLFLAGIRFYVFSFAVTPETVLQLWVFILWIFALADGDGRIPRSVSGKYIAVLAALSVIALARGVAAGNDPSVSMLFLKSMLGYLFFFPCMWMLRKRRARKLLVAMILAVSVIASLWVIAKGFMGGEGVYIRATSGLRVTSRELNVVMLGILLAGFALWKGSSRLKPVPGALLVILMGAALLLGQSRALWLAVATGALVAFAADLGGTGRRGVKLGPMAARALLIVVFTAGSIAFVHAAGLLTPADVAARGGGADGGLMGDVSLWARFLSWWEIIRTVTASPGAFLFGTGFGYEITYFRPDLLAVVSMPYVDGSFFQLLLNTGLVGMIFLALLYAHGIAGSFRLALRAAHGSDSLLALWLTASFTALTIASLSSSVITNYRFTCIWAFLFALMETMKRDPGRRNG